ncbi:MAG: glutamine ABC transporter ATP-binding protein, partial [Thermotogae bacterium]
MNRKNTVLRVENLRKSYGRNVVLKDVSLEICEGETKVIIGPSGTGKSTLLSCINRLTEPDSGKIWLENAEITQKNVVSMRQKIGFVFQDFNLFNHLNALDNVRIALLKVQKVPREVATRIA